jgi:hypothetical protein
MHPDDRIKELEKYIKDCKKSIDESITEIKTINENKSKLVGEHLCEEIFKNGWSLRYDEYMDYPYGGGWVIKGEGVREYCLNKNIKLWWHDQKYPDHVTIGSADFKLKWYADHVAKYCEIYDREK